MSERSLRVDLLVRLATGLVVLLALDALACYFTALHFANLVYDRWLIDSTRSLAQAVAVEQGRIKFDLPRVALQVFQFDEVDKTYFKIASQQRGYIAGDVALRTTAPALNGIGLDYGALYGQRVRIVSTRIAPAASGDVVTVAVAETLFKRATLAREILLVMVAPQIALLAVALTLAWLGVSRGLKPLTDLADEIEARDQGNLAPLPETGLPRETRVLVGRINDLLARVGSAISAQKRFVADAAHQLRTPLAAILLHAERAERAPDRVTEREALHALHRSVDRAAHLSRQLLALARAEPEAAAAVPMQPVDLSLLARNVGEEWIARALERDVDFGLSVPEARVLIEGDERLLSEMLSNLIDNALRYGQAAGRVTVMVEGGSAPRLSVQDDGPGIPPEERTRIFERFYRLPGSDGEGCGLGLAIVAEIAHRHGATVEVTSASGSEGTRVSILFKQFAALARPRNRAPAAVVD